MREQCLQDHEAGLSTFASGFPIALDQQRWALLGMVVPSFGSLGGQGEDAGQAALALTNRVGGHQSRISRIMAASVAAKRTRQEEPLDGGDIAKRQWPPLKGVPGIFSFPGLFRDQIGFWAKKKGYGRD